MVGLKSICEGRKARRISNCKFVRGRGLLAKQSTLRKVLVPRVTTNSPISGKGSEADIAPVNCDVRYSPESRPRETLWACPLCAKSGSRRNQISGIDSSARRARYIGESVMMADGLGLVGHGNPVQQSASPSFCRG
jgi:hypothetical protein